MLKGYRTYVLGTMTVIGATAAYLVGDTSLTEAINLSINAILLMFVRSGVTAEVKKLAP